MILEILAVTLTVVGITHSVLERAIEEGDEWIALDSIGTDTAESLNESGLTDEWTAEDYAALNY